VCWLSRSLRGEARRWRPRQRRYPRPATMRGCRNSTLQDSERPRRTRAICGGRKLPHDLIAGIRTERMPSQTPLRSPPIECGRYGWRDDRTTPSDAGRWRSRDSAAGTGATDRSRKGPRALWGADRSTSVRYERHPEKAEALKGLRPRVPPAKWFAEDSMRAHRDRRCDFTHARPGGSVKAAAQGVRFAAGL
jgi:hypothetical protein